MSLIEKVVYGFLSLQVIVFIFLLLYLVYSKLREARRLKKISSITTQIEPIILPLFEEASEKQQIEPVLAKLQPYLKNELMKETVAEFLSRHIELVTGTTRDMICELAEQAGLVDREIRRLQQRNIYSKALACRRLGHYRSKKALPLLLEAVAIPNIDVKYNALLAISKSGDEESFAAALTDHCGCLLLSERSLIEIIDSYEGDKVSLFRRVLPEADDFLASVLIKSAGNSNLLELADEILKQLKEGSVERRIAAIKALGSLRISDYEEELAAALEDSDWRIRAVAAKALGEAGTRKSVEPLKHALTDREWWVRYNAAHSLAKLGAARDVLEEFEQGNDRFAAEMLKFALGSGQVSPRLSPQES